MIRPGAHVHRHRNGNGHIHHPMVRRKRNAPDHCADHRNWRNGPEPHSAPRDRHDGSYVDHGDAGCAHASSGDAPGIRASRSSNTADDATRPPATDYSTTRKHNRRGTMPMDTGAMLGNRTRCQPTIARCCNRSPGKSNRPTTRGNRTRPRNPRCRRNNRGRPQRSKRPQPALSPGSSR